MEDKKPSDIFVRDVEVSFQPVVLRVPLKFGSETVTEVSFARVRIEVENRRGHRSAGWGESPLNVGWAWPSDIPHRDRSDRLEEFCRELCDAWRRSTEYGHAMELGCRFIDERLPSLRDRSNARRQSERENSLPRLAALICAAPFDLALHDAYGMVNGMATYRTYGPECMNCDLSAYFADSGRASDFAGRYPSHYLRDTPPRRLTVWHLVGGGDALRSGELSGCEPEDGYPVTLEEWLRRDGPMFLKIKLTGIDATWDYRRLVDVGRIGLAFGTPGLSADFNCTVTDGVYVPDLLEHLRNEYPRIYDALRYVEQPFAADMHSHDPEAIATIAVHKPVFMDESADDWRKVALGGQLGWTGVALKTCKTQTGALLALAWARECGMEFAVQDLSNARLAQIPHVLLGAHSGAEFGVESNGMQFYPEASAAEARVHPGVYRRKEGALDIGTIAGAGFGYRISDIVRER